MKNTKWLILVIVSLIMGGWGGACSRESRDYTQAKKELDALISSNCKMHTDAAAFIQSSDNIPEILSTINNVTMTKQGISAGIDRIAMSYPDLSADEIELISTFMGEKVQELNAASQDFIMAIDGVIRKNTNNQAVAQPLILALKDYQMLGQE